MKNKIVKRFLRISAFALGVGLAALGAGNVLGFSALQSALFGASMAVIGLVGAILLTYAAKGEVPDADFDGHVNSAIENVRSKSK
jgi:hypothetical protein